MMYVRPCKFRVSEHVLVVDRSCHYRVVVPRMCKAIALLCSSAATDLWLHEKGQEIARVRLAIALPPRRNGISRMALEARWPT